MNIKETILVTGASGFIGEHVCCYLLDHGYHVRALVRNKDSYFNRLHSHPKLQKCFGDLLDAESLYRACKEVDAIVHLAGLAHANNLERDQLFKVNVHGTKLLLTAAESQSVKKFVLISSSLAAPEGEKFNSLTSYGQSKRAAEELVLSSHNPQGLKAVILRPVNVYGAGMQGNIATLISLIARKLMLPLPLVDTKISLLGVGDLSEAINLAIRSGKANGNTYIVTDGRQYFINDIERGIYRAVGREMPGWKLPRLLLYAALLFVEFVRKAAVFLKIWPEAYRGLSLRTYQNLVNDSIFDNLKIIDELGFQPKTTFYNALPEIVESINRRNEK